MARYVLILLVVLGTAVFGPDLAMQAIRHPIVVALLQPGESMAPGGASDRIGRTLVLRAAGNGHSYTQIQVNGRAVEAMIDTGASTVALPHEAAAAAGIRPLPADYTVPVGTANGTVKAARVRLRDLRLGTIRLNDVEAMVLPEGALRITLVGMSALARLSTVDIRGRTMRLVQ